MVNFKDLERINLHWKKDFFYNYSIERDFVKQVLDKLNLGLITGIFGIRRVGKTTALKQIIDHLIKRGTKREHILFYSFDTGEDIFEVIDEYEKFLGSEINNKLYLFFDEIQFSPEWKAKLKKLYDTYKPRIIITGSQTTLIKQKTISLAGRINEIFVGPLSFREFLRFKKKEKLYGFNLDLKTDFENYLYRQLPEVINWSLLDIKNYINSIYKKIIYEDLPNIYEIRQPEILEKLFLFISESPGIILSINELSQELGINRNTLSNYIKYLEDSFLIKRLYNYSKNLITSQKKLKKFYTWPVFSDAEIPLLVESFVAMMPDIKFFWRDKQKHEVDAIFNNLAIEVKYRKNIRKKELNSLYSFLEKHKNFKAVIVAPYNIKQKNINNLYINNLNILTPWQFESLYYTKSQSF